MSSEGQPRIICLCGSTKFMSAFDHANRQETLDNQIVVSVGVDLQYRDVHVAPDAPTRDVIKKVLDPLHKRKIDLADEILVINVDGYIGKSTEDEIRYAVRRRKPVRLLHQDKDIERKIKDMQDKLDAIVNELCVQHEMAQSAIETTSPPSS